MTNLKKLFKFTAYQFSSKQNLHDYKTSPLSCIQCHARDGQFLKVIAVIRCTLVPSKSRLFARKTKYQVCNRNALPLRWTNCLVLLTSAKIGERVLDIVFQRRFVKAAPSMQIWHQQTLNVIFQGDFHEGDVIR